MRHESIIEGSFDWRFVPYVYIEFVGWGEPKEVFVDTGCNGDLLMHSKYTDPAYGLQWESTIEDRDNVKLADGKTRQFDRPSTKIVWFGVERQVTVWLTHDEDIMLGTRLLSDCVLEIDFRNRRVRITNLFQ
ncbi:hypothetical protein HY250_02440 [Candidatus Azambacteria bacterium]|nr:hypothetical protein [Candidatus Azambacteria bacterium]MBI3685240.1 hypothetical protein [Candidatus Azambacteria bacterium]